VKVLVAEGVWKSYPRWQPGTRSLRSMLSPTLRSERRSTRTRWALNDVSFSLEGGEVLGVIGHNGAGKSTLLRLASGISRPTRGSIQVSPSTASVLSLGDTFNADLSGAANAITAAVIGGLTPSAARAALPQAIEFAELEEFQEAPVRSYSDGMKLRLAFGVMTLLTPQLLIVDEILAVGDLAFQEKCMNHLASLRERGTAIVLASHDMEQISEQSNRALLLSHGETLAYGDVETVIAAYRDEMRDRTLDVTPGGGEEEPSDSHLVLQTSRFGSQEMSLQEVSIAGQGTRGRVKSSSTLELNVGVRAGTRSGPVAIAVLISRVADDVKCIDINTEQDDVTVDVPAEGSVTVSLRLGGLELRPGRYWIDVGVFPLDWSHALDYHYHVYQLQVTGASDYPEEPVFLPDNRRWSVGRPA
jgi:lipopolysaccharide transport system ATP-binding protein